MLSFLTSINVMYIEIASTKQQTWENGINSELD